MDAALIKKIVRIVFMGVEMFSDSRKKKFKKKWHKFLGKQDEAEDASYPEYTDADLQIVEQEMGNFLDAYREELIAHNVETANA